MTGLLALLAMIGLTISSCDNDDGPTLSDEAGVLSFSFDGLTPPVAATINGTAITATLAYNVNVTALVPTITVSEGASVAPASGIAQDFTAPVTYTVTAENGREVAYTVTVTLEEPPVLAVSTIWTRNLLTNNLPSWFTANNDRDIAVFEGTLYVHNNNDKIRALNAATGADLTVRDTLDFIDGRENFSSGNLFLLGMDTDNQGRIVASNLRVGSAEQFNWNVYVWDNKDASQQLLFQYPTPEGFRLGENLSVVGNVRGNGIIYVPGSGFGTSNNQVLKFTINNGTVNTTPTLITLSGITNIGNAPHVVPVSDAANANIIVAGTGMNGIAEFTASGSEVGRIPAALNTGETALLFTFALDVAYFEIAGRRVVAATSTDFTANAANAGFLYLIDITDGWNNLTTSNIARVPFTPAGNIDTNFNGTGGVSVTVNGDEAIVYAVITNFGVGAYRVRFQ